MARSRGRSPIYSEGARHPLRSDKMGIMERDDPTSARLNSEMSDATRRSAGETGEDSGWVTTKVAAKALGVSRRMVQEYVRRGELQAIVEGKGVNKTYYVSIDSLSALRERRKREAKGTPNLTNSSSASGRTANLNVDISESTGKVLHRIIEKLEARTAEAADLKARLELTAQAETTAREERERLLTDLEKERERADRLEEELNQARRGWLRRFFGF
jgi:hypothetical protein